MLQWISKICSDDNYVYVYEWLEIGDIGHDIWTCNLTCTDCVLLWNNDKCYWSQLLKTWAEVHYRDPQNGHEVMEEIIW